MGHCWDLGFLLREITRAPSASRAMARCKKPPGGEGDGGGVNKKEKKRQKREISANSISLDSLSVFHLSFGVGHEAYIGPAKGIEMSTGNFDGNAKSAIFGKRIIIWEKTCFYKMLPRLKGGGVWKPAQKGATCNN